MGNAPLYSTLAERSALYAAAAAGDAAALASTGSENAFAWHSARYVIVSREWTDRDFAYMAGSFARASCGGDDAHEDLTPLRF